MSPEIIIPSYLQPYTESLETVELNGKTIGDCLDSLIERFNGIKEMLFDNNGILHSYVGIYVNGEDAYPEQLAKPVKKNDRIHVIYIIGGG